MKTQINAKQIKSIRTLSSIYDNGKIIELSGNGKTYRMDVNEFLKLLNDTVVFSAEKKQKHTYLTIDVSIENKVKWLVVYKHKDIRGKITQSSIKVEIDADNEVPKSCAIRQARKELKEKNGFSRIKIVDVFMVDNRNWQNEKFNKNTNNRKIMLLR